MITMNDSDDIFAKDNENIHWFELRILQVKILSLPTLPDLTEIN